MQYITETVGSGGGHSSKAGGFISESLLGDTDISEFIRLRILSYHNDTDIIYPNDNPADISDMEIVSKKQLHEFYIKLRVSVSNRYP